MVESQKTPIDQMIDRAWSMFPPNPLIAPQFEKLLSAQEGILDATRTFSDAWFERRRAAAKDALKVARDLGGDGHNQASLLDALARWQRGSAERLSHDLQDWIGFCVRCSGRFVEAEMANGSGKGGRDASHVERNPDRPRAS